MGLKDFAGKYTSIPGIVKNLLKYFHAFRLPRSRVWDVMCVAPDWYLWRRREYLLISFYGKVCADGGCWIFISEVRTRSLCFKTPVRSLILGAAQWNKSVPFPLISYTACLNSKLPQTWITFKIYYTTRSGTPLNHNSSQSSRPLPIENATKINETFLLVAFC